MSSAIDLNAMATSIYSMILNLQNSITETVGLDCMWCRALPYTNSEDVVVQEYTLSNVDCPRALRIIVNKTDYNPGAYSVDLWGIQYEQPLEISINISTWQEVYGVNTQPQKGDIVVIQMLNRIFEVQTATTVHSVGEMPTAFSCQLKKYSPMASRRETDDLRISIDELTVSQEELFGETISREAADAAVEAETAYNAGTFADPYKDCDLNSIIVKSLTGIHGNVFSEAHYAFVNAHKNVTYNISADFDITDEYNHWIYTCWFRATMIDAQDGQIKILSIYRHDRQYYWFNVTPPSYEINDGDEVYIYRGTMLKIPGVMVTKETVGHSFALRIATSDYLAANAKLTNWWQSGIWRMKKTSAKSSYNILTGYSGDDALIKINLTDDRINIKWNNVEKTIMYTNGSIQFDETSWYYISLDICPSSITTVVRQLDINIAKSNSQEQELYGTDDSEVYSGETKISMKTFSIDKFTIENMGQVFYIGNIRLYENMHPFGDGWKKDMYQRITSNASKLILVDAPAIPNELPFVTPLK